MGKWILGQFYIFMIFLLCVYVCDSQEQSLNTYTISTFSYARTVLRPYDWRYIRVELPPWFSTMSLALESDTDVDLRGINNGSSVPMICFREGSPPIPDVYNTSLTGLVSEYISNGSFVASRSLQNSEKCYPMQKNIRLRVTNEQITPGTWFFGLFNGIGPVRTQSKMINRGSGYSFSGNITVEGCTTPTMWGQFCNQTVNVLSCSESYNLTATGLENGSFKGMNNNAVACRNANGIVCHEEGPDIYSLDVMGMVKEISIAVTNLTLNGTNPSNMAGNFSLMCYARHGAVPLKSVYDFSIDISKASLVINFPKAGRWYITVQAVDNSNTSEMGQGHSFKTCYLLVWQVNRCPLERGGLNCTFETHNLQTVVRKDSSVPFESNYIPRTQEPSNEFPLEPFLSNYSTGGNDDGVWTYFLLDVPYGATGGNIHIHLSADSKIKYELYARYGGLPSLSNWDYFYTNSTSNSNGSMFFKLYDSSEETISFYMLYARGGTWSLGLRQLNPADSSGKTDISLSLERCPQKCSSHGSCQSSLDTSRLLLYSYCVCDRNHGGFDCSVELVSHRGHIKQSIFLIASNAAAILPAYWALRNKAFAEWVLYTSSGISSALYHSCDVGTWCVLSFRVLQFLDFWLSFMAVVSTFVYLASISEVSKRTIHTIIAIVTALLAETGPTRSKNIGYVIGLGTLGLLVGWALEFFARRRTFSLSPDFHLNLLARWEIIKEWFRSVIKTLIKRFRWGFVIAGFAALAMAAVSWKMESTQSYWIWHSLWHISIYSSSFLFLCSKANTTTCERDGPLDGNYELTRQNSFNRDEQRIER
ncbi:uncharacterized protein LOC121751274 [Salvia splendens]|uniref:uncharacterized protein LOC121751274 n=1 Tax=Salvia splendens TaxID=180675 RepID=UPI001C273B57|nr:uncharacterized protein LOC121751274 [Salvia splendens]